MVNIHDGFITVNPYIIMDDVSAALDFYVKALDAVKHFCTTSPDGTIKHAEIIIGNSVIMLGQSWSEKASHSAKKLGSSSVSFYVCVNPSFWHNHKSFLNSMNNIYSNIKCSWNKLLKIL